MGTRPLRSGSRFLFGLALLRTTWPSPLVPATFQSSLFRSCRHRRCSSCSSRHCGDPPRRPFPSVSIPLPPLSHPTASGSAVSMLPLFLPQCIPPVAGDITTGTMSTFVTGAKLLVSWCCSHPFSSSYLFRNSDRSGFTEPSRSHFLANVSIEWQPNYAQTKIRAMTRKMPTPLL